MHSVRAGCGRKWLSKYDDTQHPPLPEAETRERKTVESLRRYFLPSDPSDIQVGKLYDSDAEEPQ